MRILFVHNEYARPSGEEHAVRSLADLVAKHGHRVDWFVRSSAEIRSVAERWLAFCSGVYSFRAKRKMLKTLRLARPHLVQAQNLYPLLSPSVLRACRESSVPVVMRCPNYRLFCPNGLHLSHGEVCERCLDGKEYWCLLRNCERDYCKSLGYALRNSFARISKNILDCVNIFMVLSEFQKKRFIAGGVDPEKIEILPNMSPEMNGGLSGDNPGHFITFVGRASPEKGIEQFVEAARLLPDLPFAVAGATDRMPQLAANGPKNIQWLGFLAGHSLTELYDRSRILVVPSICFEGFPNSITQAMARARPVIASRIGGVPEIVTDGTTGLLVKAGDVQDMVARIDELYHNPDRCRKMGDAGRVKAEAQYSAEVVYRRLMEIYSKAMGHAV